ncbi:EamA family transporter [Filimonas effusa]|uniref:EamA family transporter n=1 Tax=Filimonas effusa TaxID=2508721 RepID=A0A4Q1D8M6_9BACT|nr:EamA family transporter [Filimonas effusa]RXK85641.1 EamA family transporter [Filimonas effusa]
MNQGNKTAWLALLALCIIWGTTFLAARVGVKAFPPLLFMGTRHMTAGLLLLIWGSIRRRGAPTGIEFKQQLLPAIMLVALGNGIVAMAVKHIPSGLAALLCAMMPVYVTVISLFKKNREPLNAKIVMGLLLGMGGLMVIFKDNLAAIANPQYLGGIAICLVSCLFFAMGSVYTKGRVTTTDVFIKVGLQLFMGGIVLLLGSAVVEKWSDVHRVPAATVCAILYLIFFGSILAFLCFDHVLSHLPVGLATIYAYVNPLVAIVLGFVVLREPVTAYTLLAFSLTITGIFLINAGHRRKDKPAKRRFSNITFRINSLLRISD